MEISDERATWEYLFCMLILFIACVNFVGWIIIVLYLLLWFKWATFIKYSKWYANNNKIIYFKLFFIKNEEFLNNIINYVFYQNIMWCSVWWNHTCYWT